MYCSIKYGDVASLSFSRSFLNFGCGADKIRIVKIAKSMNLEQREILREYIDSYVIKAGGLHETAGKEIIGQISC